MNQQSNIIDELSERWINSGLKNDDIILLHSNLKRTFLECKRKKQKITTASVLKSFLNVIGQKGTLILPLFNFDFTKGKNFDFNNTKSQMGLLTEELRKNYNIERTGHPVYSFGIIGGKKKEFKNVDNFSAYSASSPFGIIHKLNGKIGILDLEDQNSMTYYHYIEEQEKVAYRYFTNFSGYYINKNNMKSKKTYSILVRKSKEGVLTHVNPMGEILWKEGIYTGSRPFANSGLRSANSSDIFCCVRNIIKKNKSLGILYKISK